MFNHPAVLAILLVSLVAALLRLEKLPALEKVFHFLPVPFWCYFLPMILASCGALPAQSPVYGFITTYLLASCLFLLLLGVNVGAILRLGPMALGTTLVGSFGIGLGAVVSYALFAHRLPPEMWKGVGALSASWTGGSANMLAVKESLHAPENVFAPMVIVDTIMTYAWMGLMIALAGQQARWDRWVKADITLLEEAREHSAHAAAESVPASFAWGPVLIGLGIGLGWITLRLGEAMPWHGTVLNPKSWAFLGITTLGILASFTPVRRLENYGASRWGSAALYLLLAAIGAQARIQDILATPLVLVMAVLWIAIHAGVLILYGKFRRIPMFFLVAATQANIGGTASAPIVAGIYQPSLVAVGLLLAIFLNIIGTGIGLCIAQACHFFAGH